MRVLVALGGNARPRRMGGGGIPTMWMPGRDRTLTGVAAGFVQATGRRAVIGALENIEKLVAGTTGTSVVPSSTASRQITRKES